MNFLKRIYELFKHRQKLTIAIPINGVAYDLLKKNWQTTDMDMGDTILRLADKKPLPSQVIVNSKSYDDGVKAGMKALELEALANRSHLEALYRQKNADLLNEQMAFSKTKSDFDREKENMQHLKYEIFYSLLKELVPGHRQRP